MIEMLGVLAIIGVLTVGGIAGYSKAMEHLRNNKIANNISQMATNILTLYAQQKDFRDVYDANITKLGILPDDLQGDRWGRVYDSLHNRYTIDTNGDVFIIGFHTTSKETCLALATLNWEDYSSNLNGVLLTTKFRSYYYGSDACSYGWTKGYIGKDYIACRGYLPISPAIAEQICNNIPYNGHSMVLEFSK